MDLNASERALIRKALAEYVDPDEETQEDINNILRQLKRDQEFTEETLTFQERMDRALPGSRIRPLAEKNMFAHEQTYYVKRDNERWFKEIAQNWYSQDGFLSSAFVEGNYEFVKELWQDNA